MKLVCTIIAAACFPAVFTSCDDKEALEVELANEQLKLKIELYENKKREECLKLAFQEAEAYVDSFFLQADLQPIRQMPYQPLIQKKPEFVPVDSSVFNSESYVKPIKSPS